MIPGGEPLPTLGGLFSQARDAFRTVEIDTPALDARVLLLAATGLTPETLIAAPERVVMQDAAERFANMVQRRLSGEPVSRILGYREFYGRRFALSSATLDPRADTETLVNHALDVVRLTNEQDSAGCDPLTILDLGTGSGAIIISLLCELPQARGTGIDISGEAIGTAQKNAIALGVDDRLDLVCANWTDGLEAQFDIIVSNPPYIDTGEIAGLSREVALHDPMRALDGGEDGLEAYRLIIPAAAHHLAPKGWLIVEIGAMQAEAVMQLFRENNFEPHERIAPLGHDLAGRPRVVSMQLNRTT